MPLHKTRIKKTGSFSFPPVKIYTSRNINSMFIITHVFKKNKTLIRNVKNTKQ